MRQSEGGLLVARLLNDAGDVGLHVLVRAVEVAHHDADGVGAGELRGRTEALLAVLDPGRHALGELVGGLPVLPPHLEQHQRVLHSVDLEELGVRADGPDQPRRLLLLLHHRLPQPLESVVQEGVVELDGVVPPREAHDPVLVVHHVVVIREVVLEEGELQRVAPEGLAHDPLVTHVEQRPARPVQQQLREVDADRVDALEQRLLRPVLLADPRRAQEGRVDVHPHPVLLAQLHHAQVGVDGRAEGVPPAAAEPEGDQPRLHVGLHDLHELVVVDLVVEPLRVVAVGDRPAVVDVLESERPLGTDVVPLSEVPHQLQHLRVVAGQFELLQLAELGHVRRIEDRLSRRVVYDTAALAPQQETVRQPHGLGAPVHHGVLELGEGGGDGVGEVGGLEGGGEHLGEDAGDVDGGGVVAEVLGRLPVHNPRHDRTPGPLQQVLDRAPLLGRALGEGVPQETGLGVGVDGSVGIAVDFLDELDHLPRALLEGLEVVVGVGHGS